MRETVKTSEQSLVHVINKIQGERHMTFEESSISQWLFIQLKDKVDNLLICNPAYVAKKQGAKTDFQISGRKIYGIKDFSDDENYETYFLVPPKM